MHMQQLTNFPYIENDFDALTDYELLCLVVKYLNDVIDNSNEQNTSITNLYNAFLQLQTYMNNSVQELEDAWNAKTDELEEAWTDKTTELETAFNNLQTWINNYFDNLDVQDEINNKLDEMLEDGVLEQIIEQFLQSTALWCFDTVASMKAATNLTNGSYTKTLGFYSLNDGGSSTYKIRTKTNEDTIDESTIISLNDPTLIAELIVPNELNIRQVGGLSDGSSVTTALTNAIKTSAETIYFPEGTYLLDNTLIISKNLKGYKATINVNRTNESEFTIEFTGNNLKIENLNFHQISSNKLLEVRDSDNIIISNCKLTSELNRTGGSLLDLYRNNTNILIENSYFETHSTGIGCVCIREGSTDGYTSNILFDNCEFIGDTQDETIAIWGWLGTVENVNITNSKITRPLNTNITNAMTITIGQGSGVTKNCGFTNCVFDIYQNTSCLMQGKRDQDENIFIKDCIINSRMETLSNGLFASETSSSDTGMLIENCIINELNQTGNPSMTNTQTTKFKNCTINCATQITISWGDYENCTFNNNPNVAKSNAIAHSIYAKNCTFNGINNTSSYLIGTLSVKDSIKIDNCKFYGTLPYRFIVASGTAYNSSVPFILSNSFIHGQVNADSTNILKGYVCGNYNSYTGMGTQSTNLAVANNEINFTYQ